MRPDQEYRESSGEDGDISDKPLICSLDSLEVGSSYAFNPALRISIVSITSKHHLGQTRRRHPNFLIENIQAAGLSYGRLIYKSAYNEAGIAIGTFSCQCEFYNKHTQTNEMVLYNVSVKFSKTRAEGIQVDVQLKVKDVLDR